MTDHHFISHSRLDDDVALRLADELATGPPAVAVWIYLRNKQPALDWDEQIPQAIDACRDVLFLMSEDSVAAGSNCKDEWSRALGRKKRVIPIRLSATVEAPFRLASRQAIDFSVSCEAGLAELRKHLAWCDTPEGFLQELRDRLADARRELPRAAPAERGRIQADIEDLRRDEREQVAVLADPSAAARATEQRIESGLERERRPANGPEQREGRFVNPPPTTTPAWFRGRDSETERVLGFLRNDVERLLTVAGRGGVGKTGLVCRVLQPQHDVALRAAVQSLALRGVVYLSPVGAHPVNLPNLFADLTRLVPPADAERLRQLNGTNAPVGAKMLALLESLPSGRSVLLLDNLEDLLDPGTGTFIDDELLVALTTILSAPQHGLKIVITTRMVPADLPYRHPGRQHRLDLDDGLPSPAAQDALRAMDADGRLGLRDAEDSTLDRARQLARGYPRALEMLAGVLKADRDTSLLDILEHTATSPPDRVVEVLVGEGFGRLDRRDREVLQALAVFGVPVPPVAVDVLLAPEWPTVDSAPSLSRLVNMFFAGREGNRYFLHPIDRAYALGRLAEQGTAAVAGRVELMLRAADYYERIRAPRERWTSLVDVEPQLREFELRLAADDVEHAADVLLDVARSIGQWSHYELLAGSLVSLLGRVDERTTIEVDNWLGWCRTAQGRCVEAAALHRNALAAARRLGDQREEVIALTGMAWCARATGSPAAAAGYVQRAIEIARNLRDQRRELIALLVLSQCQLALGKSGEAADLCEQALTLAQTIEDEHEQGVCQVRLAECCSRQARLDDAVVLADASLQNARAASNRRDQAAALRSLGTSRRWQGRFDESAATLEEGRRLAQEIGDTIGELASAVQVGWCRFDRGSVDDQLCAEAEVATLARSRASTHGAELRPIEAELTLQMGAWRLRQKRTAEADALTDEALQLARAIADPHLQVQCLAQLAECRLGAAEPARAAALAEDALALVRTIEAPLAKATVFGVLGRCRAGQGRPAEAAAPVGRGLDIARRSGADALEARLAAQLPPR